MKEELKSLAFRLLGKDPEGVIVSFCTGPEDLSRQMVAEIKGLIPDRRHFVVGLDGIQLEPGGTLSLYRQLRRQFAHLRIALAPVLFAGPPSSLRRAACLLAPARILAYNAQLERHHLRISTPVASALFLGGIPVDRIYLRPRWLNPGKTDISIYPDTCRILEGRVLEPGRRRIAVLSPYVPYPLSHGGAVRIFHLLREAARECDIFLFAFADAETDADIAVLQEFCARVVLVGKSRYREPRWSTLKPPEVHEFDSPAMRRALAGMRQEFSFDAVQVEYTHLAGYGGDILVEHDITFDLFQQVLRREHSLSALWNFLRWRRYELTAIARFARVVVMSDKDTALLGGSQNIRVIENGVDLSRFVPEPETPGQRVLFVGSFRHFPNIEAYRFFTGQVWPRLRGQFPEMTLTVVAGPDHLIYWRQFTRLQHPEEDPRIRLLGFIADVRPLYAGCNLVIVPTTVSAGTNVKVLEAMAMERAIVSTSSGCAGIGLRHRDSVWVADTSSEFADGIAQLLTQPELRARLAATARRLAVHNYDWKALGEKQRRLYRELLDVPSPATRQRRRRRVQ